MSKYDSENLNKFRLLPIVGYIMSLIGFFFRTFYETAAKKHSYESLLQQLEENKQKVYERMSNARPSTFNRSRAAHVIGIERWGIQRLRVLLGEPLVIDEYDGYAPSEQLTMEQFAEAFMKTRAETMNVVRELQRRGVALTQTVKHNEVGDLSARGWIFYLENHMGRETMLLAPQGSQNKEKPATQS